MSVGIERMPSLPAIAGFSSILSLATLILPCISVAISSSDGAIIRQGPHHSAQKSTTTGSLDFNSALSNVESVTFAVDMMCLSILLDAYLHAPAATGSRH